MIEIGSCIHFWKDHLELRQDSLTDYQYKVMVGTIRHLEDYKKLKEQVYVKMPFKPSDDTR